MPVSLPPDALEQIRALAFARVEAVVELAQRICAIPAPTGNEGARAEFVAAYVRERGYTPEIDSIGNVYIRRGKQAGRPVLLLLAHMDTVFPLDTPLTIVREGEVVRGPGIGDNSLGVATLLVLLDMLDELGWETEVDLIAVANVGEEGLGNLRGARAAVERYLSDIGAVLVVDGRLGYIVNGAVGSQRWRITVRGPGGHSFGSFGVPSAIHGLGRIIAEIADIIVPTEPRTTYNVGVIEGGTSVNTIAASATALLDLRSTDPVALEQLATQLRTTILTGAGSGLTVEIEVLGERPSGQQDSTTALAQMAGQVLSWLGLEPKYVASSTDANIPISLQLPTVCVGVTYGEKAHTLEEFIHIPPIGKGLAQILRLSIEAAASISQGQIS